MAPATHRLQALDRAQRLALQGEVIVRAARIMIMASL